MKRPAWFRNLSRETQQYIREVERMAASVGHSFEVDRVKAEMFDHINRKGTDRADITG